MPYDRDKRKLKKKKTDTFNASGGHNLHKLQNKSRISKLRKPRLLYTQIDKPISDFVLDSTQIYKNQEIQSSSVSTIHYVSGSDKNSLSSSHWQSLHKIFYYSGSPQLSRSLKVTSGSTTDFPFLYHYNHDTPVWPDQKHINKFNKHHKNGDYIFTSGSIISIPSTYYGERIRRGTFKLTTNNIIVKDDGYGNLYPVGNTVSGSNTSPSSSDNYVGNIFYEPGLVVLTTTESYSPGIGYHHALTGSYKIGFDSTRTIYTREYTVVINPQEFNKTMNVTARSSVSGSKEFTNSFESPYYMKELQPSISQSFSPYITQIRLWDNNIEEPVVIAALKQPIKKPTKVPLIIKIKVDWV